MKNKIIILLLIISFITGLTQLIINSNFSNSAIDATSGPSIEHSTSESSDGLSGATTVTGDPSIDAISGASLSHEDDEFDDDEHEDYEYEDDEKEDHEHEDEDAHDSDISFEWLFGDD